MKRIFVTVSMLWLAALSALLAAETVEGYLVDKMCSAEVAKKGVEAAKAHTKECALMSQCKASGYGIVTAEGKFLKFDQEGDRMAVKFLGVSSGKDNIKVTVSGKIKGGTITVIAIQRS